MKQLELKIHPPIVFLLSGVLMWGIAQILPDYELPIVWRKLSLLIACSAAFIIAFSAIISFRLAKTTLNPHRPDLSTSLVTSGIYQYTRNPMYVGLATLLCCWSIYLSNAYALVGVLGFVVYITHFQIKPEEKILTELFGQEFMDYQCNVRRWL